MEDGSETGRQQGKGAHAHKQCPDLRLAPRDGQRPDLRLVPQGEQCPDLRLPLTEPAGPARVTCPEGAAAQLEGPAEEAATVSVRRLPDGDVGLWGGGGGGGVVWQPGPVWVTWGRGKLLTDEGSASFLSISSRTSAHWDCLL